MSTLVTALETFNHLFVAKYPALLFTLVIAIFAWFTVSQLGDLNKGVERVETVDLPEIRRDIKEMRQDIVELNIRVTRVEVRLENLEKKVDALTVEVRELRADVKTILTILATNKKP